MEYTAALFYNDSMWYRLDDPIANCCMFYNTVEHARDMARFWKRMYRPGSPFGVRPMYIIRLKELKHAS